MSDIVERLRDPSSESPRWMDTMAEAADEIERLRSEIANLTDDIGRALETIAAENEESERLRARVTELEVELAEAKSHLEWACNLG